MFRKMRRFRQELSQQETIEIFQRNNSGVLAVLGDDGYPYTVPIGYIFADGNLYFHTAKQGHKIDSIRNNGKASFCVVDRDEIVPKEYTTYFASAVAFGIAEIIEDETRKREILELIAEKYAPGDIEARDREIARLWNPVCVIELKIEHMTGKAAMGIIREKENNL